jgi:hypothetical protein
MSSGTGFYQSGQRRIAPAFTLAHHAEISDWARLMRPRGLRCQFRLSFSDLEEGLLVFPRWDDEPRWLVSRTDRESIFVMLYPGLSTHHLTLAVALASITSAVDAEDARLNTV